MNEFIAKLKTQAEENPMLALGVGAAAVTAASKLIDSLAGVRSKRAYAKRMSRPSSRR